MPKENARDTLCNATNDENQLGAKFLTKVAKYGAENEACEANNSKDKAILEKTQQHKLYSNGFILVNKVCGNKLTRFY